MVERYKRKYGKRMWTLMSMRDDDAMLHENAE